MTRRPGGCELRSDKGRGDARPRAGCLSIAKQIWIWQPGRSRLSSRKRRRTWILNNCSAGAGSAAHAALQEADKASRSASPQETGSRVWGKGREGKSRAGATGTKEPKGVCVGSVPFLRQWNVVQEIRPRPCFVANYTDKDV
jgi:hypothetical protein